MSGWAALAQIASKGLDLGFANYGMKSNFQHQKLLQQRQFDFTKFMSNTAYQRSMADLKAAGLNPALLYGSGGPASTPGGSAGGSAMPSSGAPLGIPEAVLTARQASQMKELTNTQRKITGKERALALSAAEDADIRRNERIISDMKTKMLRENPDLIRKELALGGSAAQQVAGAFTEFLRMMGWTK